MAFSKATFSSLLEASILIDKVWKSSAVGIEQGYIFQPSRSFYPIWLSSEEICQQDEASSCFPVFRKCLSLLVKLGRPIWLSSEEICHQDGARSRFPAFRKRLSLLVKLGRPIWLSSEEICHEDGASSRFPAFRKRLSLLVKLGTPLSQGWSKNSQELKKKLQNSLKPG